MQLELTADQAASIKVILEAYYKRISTHPASGQVQRRLQFSLIAPIPEVIEKLNMLILQDVKQRVEGL